MFIDTHAHLNFSEFKNDYKKVIKKSFQANIKKIINIGSNFKTSEESVEIAKNFKNIYASVGVHPIHLAEDINERSEFDGKIYLLKTKKEIFNHNKYVELAKSSKKVVAIGETGLDFYHLSDKNQMQKPKSKNQNDKLNSKKIREIQIKVFKEHIRLARELRLPLILHCRGSQEIPYEAYDLMLKILKKEHYFFGVSHCFVGNINQAKEFIKMGFYLGVNGIVTFKNAKELQNVVKEIPLENILIETDCPFLAPVPYRGKRNTPEYIPIIAEKIAEIKNIKQSDVEKITSKNAEKVFGIH